MTLAHAALAALLLLAAPSRAALTPPPSPDGKVPVKIGVFVSDLVGVDEVAETFRVRGYLYTSWKDPRLAYKPRGAGDAVREVAPGKAWLPNVIMANAAGGRTLIGRNVKVRPDGTVVCWEDFAAELTMQLTFQRFPFDRQILPVVLQPFLDERETMTLIPEPGQSGVAEQSWALLAQWAMHGMETVAREAPLGRDSGFIPELEFGLRVERRSMFYVWKVFLPLFLMVLISYCALWIKTGDHAPQLSVALSAMLTQIAFLFAISGSLPRVPYLTYIDAYFLVSFLFAFATLLELIAVHVALENGRAERAARVRRASQWAYPVAYALANAAAAAVFLGR